MGDGRASLHGPLLLLILGMWSFWLLFLQAYTVPNTDFFAFRKHALSYLALQPPPDFKRLPLFPALIGLLSRVLPGGDPIFSAALALNLTLAPVCLWLIFRIARRFVGTRWALGATLFAAASPALLYAVTQPLLEMLLLTTVLLTVELSLQRSGWAYAAAGLASLTRYEAALLIPALVVRDLMWGPPRGRRLALGMGCLASLGIVVWMALSIGHHTMLNPYVEELVRRRGEQSGFSWKALLLAGEPFLPDLLRDDAASGLLLAGEVALLAVGLVVALRAQRAAAFIPLSFAAGYAMIHSLFPEFQPRYALPILWIVVLLLAVGAKALLGQAARRVDPHMPGARGVQALLGFAGAGACVYVGLRLGQETGLGGVLAYALCSLAVMWAWRGASVPALLLCLALGFGLRSASRLMGDDWVRNNCAQFKAVAEWYRQHAQPGDRMVVTMPWVVSYYSRLPDRYLVPSRFLKASSFDEVPAEFRALGVTYVVWDSDYGRNPTTYHGRRYNAALLNAFRERVPPEFELVRHIQVESKEAMIYRVRPSS